MQYLVSFLVLQYLYSKTCLKRSLKMKTYSKPCLKRPLFKDQKLVFKTNDRLMQVKSASAILSTFITLLFVIRIFALSVFEWPLKTGFTVKWFSRLIID